MTAWAWLSLIPKLLAYGTVPAVLIRRRGKPMASIGWILALIAIPIPALLLWWLIGYDHLERQRRSRRKSSAQATLKIESIESSLTRPPAPEHALLPIRRLPPEDSYGVFPPTAGNRADLLVDAASYYHALQAEIRGAREHVHLLFYSWRRDATGRSFRDLLAEKARQGVKVRLLCDGVGSFFSLGAFMDPLRQAGGRVEAFLPPRLSPGHLSWNFRNHRKIVVVDGRAGFAGGLNIGDEYRHRWHDLGARLEGPAVDQLQEVFADDWFFATGEDLFLAPNFCRWPKGAGAADCAIIASGPDTVTNVTHEAVFMAINQAQSRVWLMTPYFIPEPAITNALRSAVYRGVDVRIILPARSDVPFVRLAARSYYPELLQSGVRIFEFDGGILHAKGMLFDEKLCAIGSANFDVRSFKLNFEEVCFLEDESLSGSLRALFEADLRASHEVKAADLRDRSVAASVAEAAAHLLSPLL